MGDGGDGDRHRPRRERRERRAAGAMAQAPAFGELLGGVLGRVPAETAAGGNELK
jgi:hypothetical protein